MTLVPLAEFQEEDVTDTYNFCFTDDQKRSVFYDTVPAANVVLLFALAQNTCHAIEEVFGQVRYTSSLMPVVQHWATKGIDTTDSARVFVYSHEGTIDVAVFEEKRLLMLNSYRVHSLSDVIYFTFNLVRHLQPRPQEHSLLYSGHIATARSFSLGVPQVCSTGLPHPSHSRL